jgi:hypothetical protein
MYIINQRKNQGGNSTIGDIYEILPSGEWKWFSHIIEDDSGGDKGDKRIPAGIYELKIHPVETPKTIIFRKSSMPYLERFIEVVGIPGFSLVFFHVGNDQNDTEGCQTPNDVMGNNNVSTGKEGSGSTAAVKRFYEKVYPYLKSGGKCIYEVRDESKLWNK